MRKVWVALAVTGVGATALAGCGGASTPAAAAKKVCADVSKISGEASSVPKLEQSNTDILANVGALNGKGTTARQQVGNDALTLSQQINDVGAGQGKADPQGLVDTVNKILAECPAAGG